MLGRAAAAWRRGAGAAASRAAPLSRGQPRAGGLIRALAARSGGSGSAFERMAELLDRPEMQSGSGKELADVFLEQMGSLTDVQTKLMGALDAAAAPGEKKDAPPPPSPEKRAAFLAEIAELEGMIEAAFAAEKMPGEEDIVDEDETREEDEADPRRRIERPENIDYKTVVEEMLKKHNMSLEELMPDEAEMAEIRRTADSMSDEMVASEEAEESAAAAAAAAAVGVGTGAPAAGGARRSAAASATDAARAAVAAATFKPSSAAAAGWRPQPPLRKK